MTIDADYLAELLKRAEDPEHPGRDLAIYNLYLAAQQQTDRLEAYTEHVRKSRDRSLVAVAELGKLIMTTPPARQTSAFYKAAVDIWRTACHG